MSAAATLHEVFSYGSPRSTLLGLAPDLWTVFTTVDGAPAYGGTGVVDDFGFVQLVGFDQAEQRELFWHATPSIDEAADLYRHHVLRAEAAMRQQSALAERTRALLLPQPLTAELGEEDQWGCTDLTIGHDERLLDTRTVCLRVAGEEPARLTYTQLRAVVMAAELLLGEPTTARKPRHTARVPS